MLIVENAKSFAELQQASSVVPADFITLVRDYSGSGAAISADVCIEILDNNSIERSSILACIPNCLRGAKDQLKRNFPENAKQWARLAYDIALKSDASHFPFSAEDVHALMVQSGLVAIEFHRATGNKAQEALETGHLLSLLHRIVNADSDFDNLSAGRG